jgi:hypothetical protein
MQEPRKQTAVILPECEKEFNHSDRALSHERFALSNIKMVASIPIRGMALYLALYSV